MTSELLTKCSVCGADIIFPAGVNLVKCEYCLRVNDRPKSKPDETNLMKYANERRNMGEFKEAEVAYRKVLQACPEEHEARWGLLLCKYGVIYIEDNIHLDGLITCRRSVNTRFCSEPDYFKAIEQAPSEVRIAYEKDGRYIDQIQDQIKRLRHEIDSYDVFLCYKESDENGNKTKDSEIAHNIFNQLEKEGYRVFFAPISLRDYAGANYEASIYLAIESSRMMLAIGTRSDYFTSTYVRSEWRRFMERMEYDNKKVIIPLFSETDYLPKELKPYQGYCLNAPYMLDVISRLNKLLLEESTPWDAGYIYLKDGDFEEAKVFFQDLLSSYGKESMVWLGLAMSEEGLHEEEEWRTVTHLLEDNKNYDRAMRCAKGALQKRLSDYAQEVRNNITIGVTETPEKSSQPRSSKNNDNRKKLEGEKNRKASTIRLPFVCLLILIILGGIFYINKERIDEPNEDNNKEMETTIDIDTNRADSVDALKKILYNSTNGNLICWEYKDYDNNGTFEAFAEVQDNGSAKHLWFVTVLGASKVDLVSAGSIKRVIANNKRFFVVWSNQYNDSQSCSLVGVKGGQPYRLELAGDDIVQSSGNTYVSNPIFTYEGDFIKYTLCTFDESTLEFVETEQYYTQKVNN